MELAKTKAERFRLQDYAAIAIATGGGAGFMPKAPGTAGALVGVLVYLLMEWGQLGAWFLHVIILLFIVGTWAAHQVEFLWGHDSQRIVVDEIVGQMIVFSIAAGRFPLSAINIVIGFALFRFFDITKPFPIRRLERLPGGLGVIADDVGAGLYALGGLVIILKVIGA